MRKRLGMQRTKNLLRVGLLFALRSVRVRLALGLSLLVTLMLLSFAFLAIRIETRPSFPLFPVAASNAMTLGPGVFVVLALTVDVFRRDRREGVWNYYRSRGVRFNEYARTRMLGAFVLTFLAVFAAPLLLGMVGLLFAPNARLSMAMLGTFVGVTLFSLSYAALLVALAWAAFAPRPFAKGYVMVLLVMVLPEIVAPYVSGWLPEGWVDLLTVRTLLASFRASLLPGGWDVHVMAKHVLALGVLTSAFLSWAYLEQAKFGEHPKRWDGA